MSFNESADATRKPRGSEEMKQRALRKSRSATAADSSNSSAPCYDPVDVTEGGSQTVPEAPAITALTWSQLPGAPGWIAEQSAANSAPFPSSGQLHSVPP